MLEEIIPNKAELEWGVPTFSYPRFVQLLQLSCYSKSVLSGLVISIGGLQDFLKKASLTALLGYLQASESGKHNEQNFREFNLSTDILWVLQQYRRCERVVIPTLKTIEILFSKEEFLNMEPSEQNTYADIEAIYKCLEESYGAKQENIILYGQSMGSVLSCLQTDR